MLSNPNPPNCTKCPHSQPTSVASFTLAERPIRPPQPFFFEIFEKMALKSQYRFSGSTDFPWEPLRRKGFRAFYRVHSPWALHSAIQASMA
jgi:hypothetical protein